MAKGFKFDPSELEQGLREMYERGLAAMEAVVDTGATEMEAYAKRNARWINRTGEARRRLNASYSKEDDSFKITLAHGVDYGIWLELANEKRFAIIEETLVNVGENDVMKRFESLLDDLRGVF